MEINLKRLNQLLTVAKLGNFSRAADELHITQPALSRSIAAFENHFGIRIFDRGRSGASLTPLGKLALAEAEKLVTQARTLDHNLHLYSAGDVGKIAFGMGPLIASMILPELSSHFLKHRPKLHLQTAIKSAEILLTELADDTIEVIYGPTELIKKTEELTVTDIGKINLARIVRSDHPLAKQQTVSQQQLLNYPILSGSELSTPTMQQGIFICDNYHILRETVLSTDSVWVSSPDFLAEELNSGKLVALKTTEHSQPHHTTICEARKAGRTPSPAAHAIAEYIREYFLQLRK